MSKVDNNDGVFKLIMPAEYDYGSQVELAYPNIGFDKLEKINDPEHNEIPLIELCKNMEGVDPEKILLDSDAQVQKIRDWFMHLFAADYESIATTKKENLFWRHIIKMPGTHDFDFLREKYEETRFGPHAGVAHVNNSTIIRIKQSTYEKLFEDTRKKIQEAIELGVYKK